ncbi:MFS transporter [Glaciihabitans sp. UYNi722]|uniref:MFS transporter n=1 Tax=Glaciihabitans sp. UYNi722 TaxID=3156344 RepID=UPI0033945CC6
MTIRDSVSVPAAPDASAARASWAGVVTLMLGVFALVTSEFLPASLLSLMATDLGISEGTAGQVVTATAVVGAIAGPTIGILFPRLDRRTLMIGLTLLAAASNLLVAISPAFWLLLIARLLLGAAIAGFWSMALAVSAQLVPSEHLGRAMMIVNTGVSVAIVAAVPLGSYLGSLLGWRSVFLLVAGLAVLAAIVQAIWLRSVAASSTAGFRSLLGALRSPVMIVGLGGILLLAGGHFAGFTYIQPAAVNIPGLTAGGLAILLATYGVGGFVGNIVAGIVADRRLRLALIAMPALLGVAVASFALFSQVVPLAFVAVALWGVGFGGVPTIVQTWVARAEPDRLESAGGLVVSTFQIAIALGAVVGGLLVDGAGVTVALVSGGVSAVVGGMLLSAARRR